VIVNTGYQGDAALYEGLAIAADSRTGGPRGMGEYLAALSDWSQQPLPALSRDHLLTTEPHFHILGAKSCGRDSRFAMQLGYLQIRRLFSIIGDRDALDLYATHGNG
jgi:hypothetical protein